MSLRLKCALTLLVAVGGGGCAQRHPITVETVEPWQKSYEASVEELPPPPSSNISDTEDNPSSRLPEPMAFVSNVLAFPFRGLGWLAQKIF